MIGVERSRPAPNVLLEGSAKDRWRHADVVDRLAQDFHCKCYICEVRPVDDPQVEHRLPHKGGKHPERMFDWQNLFYSCSHCNLVKAKPKYDAGIIDCCATDPEERIVQELAGNMVRVQAAHDNDAEAKLTAELIEEVYNSDNPALRKRASAARLEKLQLLMNAFYEKLAAYAENKDDAFARATVASMLRREAPFAGFARSYVRGRLADYPELAACLEG